MKTKKVFLVVSITALVMTIALIAEKAYYVAVALAVGITGSLVIFVRGLFRRPR